MRLLILNGPNINMLGERDKKIYGNITCKNLKKQLSLYCKNKNIKLTFYQSNHEGKIIDFIQKNRNKFDGWIVNLGAYTHYSYAIGDAFDLVKKPIVEIHISDILNREPFRAFSVLEEKAARRIIGKGTQGYFEAVDYFCAGDKNE